MSENQIQAKGIKITADGTSEMLTFKSRYVSLEEMQQIVKGYIEFVYLPNNFVMVVNEEGKINNLPVNIYVTEMFAPIMNDVIVGDVLLIHNNYIN